jgi:hypothetical protein
MKIIKAKQHIEKSTKYLNKIKVTDENADLIEIVKMSNSMAMDSLNELEERINQLL